MGDPAITEWGAQYEEGNTYAMVNIPVFGALKVEYHIVDGGTFALFLETTQPVELEIGLERDDETENAESEVDVLDWVCVTYEAGAVFQRKPENVKPDTAKDGAWIHYQCTEQHPETGQEEIFPWWPWDAAFVFGGATQRQCVIEHRTVLVTEVPGPFPKPEPTVASAPAPPCTGAVLTFGGTHTDCDCVAAGGGVFNTGATGTICRYTNLAGNVACPGGWTQAANWERYATNAELTAITANTYCNAENFSIQGFQNIAGQTAPNLSFAGMGGICGSACSNPARTCMNGGTNDREEIARGAADQDPPVYSIVEVGCI